jgi:hypothetical protein
VLLLLAEMKRNASLKLPFRANQVIPDDVKLLLPTSPVPLLTDDREQPEASDQSS